MRARTVRLAGHDLGEHRHVCALFEDQDEAYRLLVPFVVEGLERGERAFHIVDPRGRPAHLDRLRSAGIDTSAALASGQLHVHTWDESHLPDGRFDRSSTLAYIRASLAGDRARPHPLTRLIATMEWAVDSVPGVNDLVSYEARLDEMLRGFPDVVVCAYDLRHHSARTIANVLGVHPVALVGGVVRSSEGGGTRATARERILTAASRLFHEAGVQATGVDALIAAAGVAKATFYRHFPSKEDLVVAWLGDPRSRWFDRVRKQAETTAAFPTEVVPQFFEAVAEWLETEGFRGCPYLNTAAEITDPAHPVRAVIREYLEEIETYFRDLLTADGYPDAGILAAGLQTLLAGSISLGVARRTSAYATAARETALRLLAEADRN